MTRRMSADNSPHKPPNPQKGRSDGADQQRFNPVETDPGCSQKAAKAPQKAHAAALPQSVHCGDTDLCGDSAGLCGGHPDRFDTAGQTEALAVSADSAVSAGEHPAHRLEGSIVQSVPSTDSVPTPDEVGLPIDTTLVLLTVEEAARRLGIGRTVCYRLISSGELESVTLGRLRKVPAEAVPEYVARLRNNNNRSDVRNAA
ncbi:DNA binding domain-containing protein, excisionase family [Streptomyces sp. WMMB 322]|nr:DNA binding domain-containing protein, excisionase family [Streptomyces sp. WMMB 322]